MATTLEDLEKRVQKLESVIEAISNGDRPNAAIDPSETEIQRHSRETFPAWKSAWEKAFAEMGIQGEPIGAEKLQLLVADTLRAQGISLDDNSFSRELIAMREE